MKSLTSLAFLAAAACGITTAGAATISFQEGVSPSGAYTADSTWIRANQAGTNLDNDPDFENIIGKAGGAMRPMFAFDLSEIEVLAGGSPFTINSVSLNLTTRPRDGGSGQGSAFTTELHEYGFAFVEGVATWNDPDGDGNGATGDTTPGGTLGTIVQSLQIDPAAAGGSVFTWSTSAAFVAAAQTALAGDDTLRLILKGNAANEAAGANQFVSFRDEVWATTGERPELVVDYTIIPEPSTATLLGLVAGLGILRRRRK